VPSIRVSDQSNVEILSAEAGPGSGIAKYFRGDVAGFLASAELVAALDKPVATLDELPVGFGLSFEAAGTFGSDHAEWQLKAGARTTVRATQSGGSIPGGEFFGDAPTVPDGRTFLALTFSPMLSFSGADTIGDLTFGFSAGAAVEFSGGRLFDVSDGHGPTLGAALKEVLSTAVVPGDLVDVTAMRAGDIGVVTGSGQFKVSASVDLAAALNPLATPTLGLERVGKLEVNAGASLTVGASVGIKGVYQIRVRKLDNSQVRVGYYKMSGAQFEFDVTASLGVGVTLGDRDLIELLTSFSTAPKADIVALVESGLSDAQIDALKAAITASVNRSLSLSLAASFSSTTERSAVFEYDFTLAALDAGGIEALHFALDGDLSKLTSRKPDALPPGVTLVHSQLETFKRKATTWRINLFGIVNILHLTELVRTGTVIVDHETGDLLITDEITAKKITIDTRPHEAVPKKLRKVLMQSMVLTAAYHASGVQKLVGFTGSMSYFEQRASVGKQDIANYVDNLVSIGLVTPAAKSSLLTGSFAGQASVFVELTFDDEAFRAMFIDAAGKPFGGDSYEAAGRGAIARLVQSGDENDFRRIPMLDDALWKTMTSLGQFSMRGAMPPALRVDPQFALIVQDYVVIRWWAAAMSEASRRVVDMRKFLAGSGADAESLKDHHDFKKKRADLEQALKEVVSNAQPDIPDAWGLVAMDTAAQRKAAARGILVTTTAVIVETRA
jgi:hypothetical protein